MQGIIQDITHKYRVYLGIFIGNTGILLILRPTFWGIYARIQPGKYLPGRFLEFMTQNVGHEPDNILISYYLGILRFYRSYFGSVAELKLWSPQSRAKPSK